MAMQEQLKDYHLPRYHEIPDVGLYLNQVHRYINEYLTPFADMEITESMISNYVKKHIIANPIKKQYSRDQIAHLIFMAISKSVLSMDQIGKLFEMRKEAYESDVAYDYFCTEFENTLRYIFGDKDATPPDEVGGAELKQLLQRVIITIGHKIYLDYSFQ